MASPSDQRREALERANVVRVRRADFKDLVHADPTWRTLADALAGDFDEFEAARVPGMNVLDLMLAAPGMGRSKAVALIRDTLGLAGASIAARRRLGELTPRQRAALAVAVTVRRRQLNDGYIDRIARSTREPYRKRANTRTGRTAAA